ncbi:hypothetical protein LCGC14_0529800 [marine sediment metagenome]|uniref:Uncharacterized protein n=1 Tax=marine sediment metagenome TaxID=412755 RepID=A0A0F9V440_9ZZZZ|nr:MAG: hypothetical protein Lokiarch_38330 [Candidatus Lokiarchaeum sp. GC14_75]
MKRNIDLLRELERAIDTVNPEKAEIPIKVLVNDFFKEEAIDFNIEPVDVREVEKYYKSDKLIWVLYQRMRLFDRFIKTKLLRKK